MAVADTKAAAAASRGVPGSESSHVHTNGQKNHISPIVAAKSARDMNLWLNSEKSFVAVADGKMAQVARVADHDGITPRGIPYQTGDTVTFKFDGDYGVFKPGEYQGDRSFGFKTGGRDWLIAGGNPNNIFVVAKAPLKETFTIAGKEGGALTALEGGQKYKEGDYLLTGPENEKYVVDPKKFPELKDVVEGFAVPKPLPKAAWYATENGSFQTAWGQVLHYEPGDLVVMHEPNDYSIVQPSIFRKTYRRADGKSL